MFLLPKVVNWFQSYDCLLERIRLCFALDVELSSCLIVGQMRFRLRCRQFV